jgi:hypothetical protein
MPVRVPLDTHGNNESRCPGWSCQNDGALGIYAPGKRQCLSEAAAVFIRISDLITHCTLRYVSNIRGGSNGSSGWGSSIGGWVHRPELDEAGKGSQPFLME